MLIATTVLFYWLISIQNHLDSPFPKADVSTIAAAKIFLEKDAELARARRELIEASQLVHSYQRDVANLAERRRIDIPDWRQRIDAFSRQLIEGRRLLGNEELYWFGGLINSQPVFYDYSDQEKESFLRSIQGLRESIQRLEASYAEAVGKFDKARDRVNFLLGEIKGLTQLRNDLNKAMHQCTGELDQVARSVGRNGSGVN